MLKLSIKTACVLATILFLNTTCFAHNGAIAHAYPMGRITIDGNLSDWPQNMMKYRMLVNHNDTKPLNESDLSAYFQIGYNVQDRVLYVALIVTDDDFIEDTSAGVRFDSQDCLEVYIDGRHIPQGSGVASLMYSQKLRNTNNSYYDPFAKAENWDNVQVSMTRNGSQRIYEWRFKLGDEMIEGKSLGAEFQFFDKDRDGSFSILSWGHGEAKYVNTASLGDVILMPANGKLGTVSGNVNWDRPMKTKIPLQIRLTSTQRSDLWVATRADSMGNYSADVPPGQYEISLMYPYIVGDNEVYSGIQKKKILITVKENQKATAPNFIVSGIPAPDYLPEKGILQENFTAASAKKVDQFIEAYQRYFQIPGVSLALIKDGKVVYHKTYGYKNAFTKEPVVDNTLFEAASITKPVFSFAVQRLAERGVIDLDKPLYLYLPYEDIAYDERYKLITARHVLTHRTGFPNWRNGKLDIKFTPGTSFGYSGEGFEYLKIVVEKITGKKVEQVLKEEVIEPMGLYHTFFSRNDSLRRMVAEGHYNMVPNYDQLPDAPGMAWSMHTEALIFTRFMLYLLEQKGLSAKTYENMMSKRSEYTYDPGDAKPKYPQYMGESLEIGETPFGKSFNHGGNNGDFKCKFEVYKDLKMGYVVFTNSGSADPLLQEIRKFMVEGK